MSSREPFHDWPTVMSTLVAGGDVQAFLISPDSDSVVYGADQDADTVDELLAVAIAARAISTICFSSIPALSARRSASSTVARFTIDIRLLQSFAT